MTTSRFQMHGGVILDGHKFESTTEPIGTLPLPSTLTIPLRQNCGVPPRCIVRPGDKVLKGQPLALPADRISAAVHAPTSGVVEAVTDRPIPHPSGLADHCVILTPDGMDELFSPVSFDWHRAGGDEIRQAIRTAGIVGLGGAAFPSDMKIYPPMETLIINGAECEPYITCDDMLMRESAEDILGGIEILAKATQAKQTIIGIESDKPEAARSMQRAVETLGRRDISVRVLPTRYPSGYAKQLIYLLTGIKIPSGVNAYQRGVQCFNVATAYSICRALVYGEPQISRVVTVTGNVKKPRNFRVLIGTPITELLAYAEPETDTTAILFGGPMMGFPLSSTAMPVTKACTCLLATSDSLFPVRREMPCIRCGSCAAVCPVHLLPYQLMGLAKADRFEDANAYHLFDCIECGCCSYVCPSDIPLVHYFKYAKSALRAEASEEKAALLAKAHFERKAKRLEAQAKERARRMAQRTRSSTTVSAGMSAQSDGKQAAIQEAIERVRQKRATRQQEKEEREAE